MAVIPGLRNPDGDVPLRYPVFPGLGNHDLALDQSGLMMDYIRQWSAFNPTTSSRHVTNSDPVSGAIPGTGKSAYRQLPVSMRDPHNTSKATDQNYAYSQDAMNWLMLDLQTYGRRWTPGDSGTALWL